MASLGSRFKVALLLLALFFARATPARASIPTETQVVLIFVGVAVIGAAIGITVYHFAHTSPSLTGCTALSAGTLTLLNEADHRSITLVGQTSELKAGERVRVSGKHQKNANSTFLVEKIKKDYGSCPVSP